ncbi:MAG: hypothetical protein JWQ97_3724 [Phenylobacterium sp.]|nr:hypothetical protein [Phenylobacterium sp.]
MSQPKNPPLSVRLPSWLLEHIKGEAAAKGLAVNAELVAVLTRAYRLGEKAADTGATPEQVMKAAKPAPKAAAAAPAANPEKLAIKVAFGGDVRRGPIQKTGKR